MQQIFNQKSKSRILHLRNRLHENFKKGDTIADDYVARLTEMAEELHEAGVVVDDGDLTLIAMNGLDESYDPFVTDESA